MTTWVSQSERLSSMHWQREKRQCDVCQTTPRATVASCYFLPLAFCFGLALLSLPVPAAGLSAAALAPPFFLGCSTGVLAAAAFAPVDLPMQS